MSTQRTAQELADDIQAAIAELADGRVFPDLVDAVNTLAAMKAVAFSEQHVQYVTRYGGNCRDCADADGVCPSSGMPCRDAEKAVRHVFKAIAYGVQHGYIPSPIAALASQAEPVAVPDECPHMIVFDDADREPLMFAGTGARAAALHTWKAVSAQWNAHLFVRIERNTRDDRYPCATIATTPAPAQAEPVGFVSVQINGGSEVGAPAVEWTPEFEALMDSRPGERFRVYAAPAQAEQAERERIMLEVGRQMVNITTTVRGPDEWLCIPELWLLCVKERDDALAKLAQAEQSEDGRDAARLDFMIESDAFVVWSFRGDGSIKQCQLWSQDEDEEYHIISGERYFNTPREAIDAAIAAKEQQS